MPSKKKLFFAVAPMFLAILLVTVILFFPSSQSTLSKQELKERSVNQNKQLLTGKELKQQIFKNKEILPVMGSSELSRLDLMHPSVLANKYNRNYIPFLIGGPGSLSLTHTFFLKTNEEGMKNKKIVFIISPQWFVKEGIKPEQASQFISPLQMAEWLQGVNKNVTDDDVYLAKRLLKLFENSNMFFLKSLMKKVIAREDFTDLDEFLLNTQLTLYQKEESLFSAPASDRKWQRVQEESKLLPKEYSFNALDQLATQEASKQMTNNPFRINNDFYSERIQSGLKTLKGSQRKFNYVKSPEYNDFEILLNEMAKLKMDVLFVIQPTNKLWTDYTGVSSKMLQTFSKKIKLQLEEQGFHHILDFSDKSGTPYFMNDTIHIGFRGWLLLDKHLQEFLKVPNTTEYTIDESKYLSRSWAKYVPE